MHEPTYKHHPDCTGEHKTAGFGCPTTPTTPKSCCENPRKTISVSTRKGRRAICNNCGKDWCHSNSTQEVHTAILEGWTPSGRPHYPAHHHTSPEKEEKLPGLSMQYPNMYPPLPTEQKEPSYIDCVVEDAKKYVWYVDMGEFMKKPFENWLREKLEGASKTSQVHQAIEYTKGFEAGRTQRTQEIVEMIEEVRKLPPSSRNIVLDDLLSRIEHET